MTAVFDELDEERARQRREALDKKAADARERYARDKAEGKKRSRNTNPNRKPRKPKYDVQDYAEEWAYLTSQGVRADEIVKRSNPSQEWFRNHILPIVTDAICSECHQHFSPRETHTLTMCSKACHIHYSRTLFVLRGGSTRRATQTAFGVGS